MNNERKMEMQEIRQRIRMDRKWYIRGYMAIVMKGMKDVAVEHRISYIDGVIETADEVIAEGVKEFKHVRKELVRVRKSLQNRR